LSFEVRLPFELVVGDDRRVGLGGFTVELIPLPSNSESWRSGCEAQVVVFILENAASPAIVIVHFGCLGETSVLSLLNLMFSKDSQGK